jgi:hypothetical protein
MIQPLTRPDSPDVGADAVTRSVIAAVQGEGTCWVGGATWHGRSVIRTTVANWATTEDDVDRSVDAILAAVRRLGAAPPDVVVPMRRSTPPGSPKVAPPSMPVWRARSRPQVEH